MSSSPSELVEEQHAALVLVSLRLSYRCTSAERHESVTLSVCVEMHHHAYVLLLLLLLASAEGWSYVKPSKFISPPGLIVCHPG